MSKTLYAFLIVLLSPVVCASVSGSSKQSTSFYLEKNEGQAGTSIAFIARGTAGVVLLEPTASVLASSDNEVMLRMQFGGANQTASMRGVDPLPARIHYLIGNDTSRWRRNVPTFARAQTDDLYPGIDVVYYGAPGGLEYDFVVRPGADPRLISMCFSGAHARQLDADGGLVLHTSHGAVTLQRPVLYQRAGDHVQQIAGAYVLGDDGTARFEIGPYDPARELIIDPVLLYSSYLGGASYELSLGATTDAAGNFYTVGETSSANFPVTAGAVRGSKGGTGDGFISKFDASGALVYSTFLGGSEGSGELVHAIAVGADGDLYVTGATVSPDFPITPGAFQSTMGGWDAFITKLDASGSSIIYSTFLGRSAPESTGVTRPTAGTGIAVDADGNAYVAGFTPAPEFPTTPGAFQESHASPFERDAFVTKLNPTGTALVYSTLIGGPGRDEGYGIALDGGRNVYVTGLAGVAFPTTPGSFSGTFQGALVDGFVAKLDPTGSSLLYATYLGSSGNDEGRRIVVDATGHAYVTGYTEGADFPSTGGALQTTSGGSMDAFVTKVAPSGSTLAFSTFLGGSNPDQGYGIAIDPSGAVWVSGGTASSDFPVTADATQPLHRGNWDAFAARIDASGSSLSYSTYAGGGMLEIATDMARAGNDVWVTGFTGSGDFPVTASAAQPVRGGGDDVFVFKIGDPAVVQSGKVNGGGTVATSGGLGTFAFNVRRTSADAAIQGQLEFVSHGGKDRLRAVTFNSFSVSGDTVRFGGACTMNKVSCTFQAEASDRGEPGRNDVFLISVDGGPAEGGILRSGNIQLQK